MAPIYFSFFIFSFYCFSGLLPLFFLFDAGVYIILCMPNNPA